MPQKQVFICAIIEAEDTVMSNGNNGKPPPLPPDVFKKGGKPKGTK